MRRLLAFCVALALLALGSACTGKNKGPQDTGALSRKAATVTDLLAKNDWKTVRQDFDATMRDGLTADGLDSAWKQVTQQFGAYKSRGEPTRVPKPGDVTVFDTAMQFQRGAMKSRVAFNSDGLISGLYILRPDVP